MPSVNPNTTKASPGKTSAKRVTRRYARTQPKKSGGMSSTSRANRWSKALTIGKKKKKKK